MPTKPALWTTIDPTYQPRHPKKNFWPGKQWIGKTSKGQVRYGKPIPKMSKRRKKESVEYSKLRKEFLELNPRCQRCLKKGKKVVATEIHHKSGRRKNYLVVVTWASSCHDCNMFAKEHAEEAIAEGWRAPIGVYSV